MKYQISNIKYQKGGILFLVCVFSFLFLIFDFSKGQVAPEFLVTWKADAYVPSGYQGRILPTRNTSVNARFELIENSQPVNISQNEIRWFVNNKLRKSGSGLKNFNFTVDPTAARPQLITISIVNYRGATLTKNINIPVADPDVVTVAEGQNIFRALPYFFNVNNLNQLIFEWSVNGIKAEGFPQNPDILDLTIRGGQAGDKINLSLMVRNLLNPVELAGQSLQLTKQ